MRIIFITPYYDNSFSGGAVESRKSYDMLTLLFGKDNVDVVYFKEKPNDTLVQKVYKNLCKFITAEQFDLKEIKQINFNKYDCVFLDTSLIGLIAKMLRRQGYNGKIVTHFHNCEIDLYNQMYQNNKWVIKYPLINLAKKNEQASLDYSDASMALNQRDCDSLHDHYNISSPIYIIPVCMEDRFTEDENVRNNSTPIYTFLGSYFRPNVDGISWFLDNVFPNVNINLRIIGKGMYKLKEKYDIPNVEILSDVPNLDLFMKEADYMLYPIFEGSGMKLKTCEALMYGKNIIGTDEAFCGYDIDDYSKIGARCNTKEDFIQAINNINLPHFNKYARNLYLSKYSYQASLKLYRKVFENLKLL